MPVRMREAGPLPEGRENRSLAGAGLGMGGAPDEVGMMPWGEWKLCWVGWVMSAPVGLALGSLFVVSAEAGASGFRFWFGDVAGLPPARRAFHSLRTSLVGAPQGRSAHITRISSI